MTIDLSGHTAIITGAGRGIGRAHAVELAKHGANVIVNDIEAELADEVAAEISAVGGSAVPAPGSVTDDADLTAMVDGAVERFGSVHMLVNNAGVLRTGYFDQLTDDQIDIVLRTHLHAAFHLTRRVWPLMKQQHYGRIIMTSSSSGLFSHQGLSNYAAAKAGLYGLTKALAFEGADHGINVNAILPYALSISPAKDAIPDMATEYAARVGDTSFVDPALSSPELVAAMVAFLVSPDCTLSGEAYSICRGRFARVFVGIGGGWITDSAGVTADDIAAHIDEIRDLDVHTVPMWLFDEVRDVVERLRTRSS